MFAGRLQKKVCGFSPILDSRSSSQIEQVYWILVNHTAVVIPSLLLLLLYCMYFTVTQVKHFTIFFSAHE